MSDFFQPDPIVIGFIFARKFVWFPFLVVLATLRAVSGAAAARGIALLVLLLCLLGIAVTFAPATGLNIGPYYTGGAQLLAAGGGMIAALIPSALMVVSGLVPGARWRWIDALHGIALVALLGVWWWVS